MPLFEFICKKCGHAFEALVLGQRQPTCPQCKSAELEPVASTFATTHGSKSGTDSRPAIGCGTGAGGGG